MSQEPGQVFQFVNGGISTLPDSFELHVVKTGERPVVRVAWQNVDEIGVNFETDDS